MPLGLFGDTIDPIDKDNGKISGGCSRCHISGVLFMSWAISENKLPC